MIFNVSKSADDIKYNNTNVAEALTDLENELTANGKRIYLDYKDGKYGYNTSELRGADTFNPFSSGSPEYTLSTTLEVGGDELGTITGCGYISIKRIKSGNSSNRVNVYIDGNTVPFKMAGSDFYFFHFTKSISFTGGVLDNIYFYQLKLTNEPSKYRVQQGTFGNGKALSLNGKGKVIAISTAALLGMTFDVDGSYSIDANMITDKPFYIDFNYNVSLMSYNGIDYIAYLDNTIPPY
jgi:hypothetical protein